MIPADRRPGPEGGRRLAAVAVVAAVIGAGLGGGIAFLAYRQLATSTVSPVVIRNNAGGGSQSTSLGSVTAEVAPSVVEVVREPAGGGQPTATDVSNGFITSSSGLVVTTAGAVEGASGVEVILASGTVLPATIAGADPTTGVVVLQVSASSLPTALQFGPSPSAGTSVIAVSLPLGGSPSVAVGSVNQAGLTDTLGGSAGLGPTLLDGLLSSDLAIPPGSSGAPVVNTSGQVVGILAGQRMETTSPGPVGLALDATAAQHLVSVFQSTGAPPPSLGVVSRYLTAASAAVLSVPAGAQIEELTPGAPAAQAGLRVGDVVEAVNGAAVMGTSGPSYPDLADLISSNPDGSQVTLTVARGQSRHQIVLTVPVK